MRFPDAQTLALLKAHGIDDPLTPMRDLFALARGYKPHTNQVLIEPRDQLKAVELYFRLLTETESSQPAPNQPAGDPEQAAVLAEKASVDDLRRALGLEK